MSLGSSSPPLKRAAATGRDDLSGPDAARRDTLLTATSILDLIGKTPLVRLKRFERETPGVELYAKAEWQNPGGSVKDRAAARMIVEGEASGALRPGQTIVDATSGNTGIAYAMIGAARGFPVKLFLPDNASPERKLILRAFGAELVLTDPLEGTDGAIRRVRQLVADQPGRYFYPDQYSNDGNWRAHFETTGPEIIEQTGGRITHFVAGLGTSGTFVGTGRALKRHDSAIQLISFQPDSPFHGLEGLKHMPSALVPRIYDATLADEDMNVCTEDAHKFVRRLAREEGLMVGISSGAALCATLTVARKLKQGVVVTVFPDGAEKYLSESFWTADE
jgi:cysteine synthase B